MWKDIYLEGAEKPSTTLVLGKIKHVHVRRAVLQESGLAIDPAKLRAVSRLGGTEYARVGDTFDIFRPSWKDYVAYKEAQNKS